MEIKAAKFLDRDDFASPTTGTVIGTPHTKSGKKLTYERLDDSSNSSPGLRKARVWIILFYHLIHNPLSRFYL